MNRKSAPPSAADRPRPLWTFLSNHGHVLLCVYQNPQIRLREVAERVGITPRMVQNIINDLDREGFISIEKQGRCNVYSLHSSKHMRHRLIAHNTVSALLQLVGGEESE